MADEIRFCKDCAWLEERTCTHPTSVVNGPDLVDGTYSYRIASAMRASDCGREARYFLKKGTGVVEGPSRNDAPDSESTGPMVDDVVDLDANLSAIRRRYILARWKHTPGRWAPAPVFDGGAAALYVPQWSVPLAGHRFITGHQPDTFMECVALCRAMNHDGITPSRLYPDEVAKIVIP